MPLDKQSFCKVNLLLNILGKRPDGFHQLETVLHPVDLHDCLSFERRGSRLRLQCSDPLLPVNAKNLVFAAAERFLKTAGIREGAQANNPHIMELPDPVTKQVWGNALLVGPARAAELGVKTEDLVRVKADGEEFELVALVVPGQHRDVVGVALGYGRTAKLRLLNGDPELPIWTKLAYKADGKGWDTKTAAVGVDVGRISKTESVTPFPVEVEKTGRDGRSVPPRSSTTSPTRRSPATASGARSPSR